MKCSTFISAGVLSLAASSKACPVNDPHVGQQSSDVLESLPEPAGSICRDQLSSASSPVVFTSTGSDDIHLDNVPTACMTLSTMLFGSSGGNSASPQPIPMGTASLEYHGVSKDQIAALKNSLSRLQDGADTEQDGDAEQGDIGQEVNPEEGDDAGKSSSASIVSSSSSGTSTNSISVSQG